MSPDARPGQPSAQNRASWPRRHPSGEALRSECVLPLSLAAVPIRCVDGRLARGLVLASRPFARIHNCKPVANLQFSGFPKPRCGLSFHSCKPQAASLEWNSISSFLYETLHQLRFATVDLQRHVCFGNSCGKAGLQLGLQLVCNWDMRFATANSREIMQVSTGARPGQPGAQNRASGPHRHPSGERRCARSAFVR